MSVERIETMMMLLGWVLFLLTLVVAVWRDVAGQEMAEKRAKEDLEYLFEKQKVWQFEKKNMNERIERLTEVNQQFASMLETARRALSRFAK